MALQQESWRENVLIGAQKRFKQFIVDETLTELAQVEKRMLQFTESEESKTDELSAKAAAASLKEVQLLQEKVKTLGSVAESNFRMQLGGMAGLDISSSTAVKLKS